MDSIPVTDDRQPARSPRRRFLRFLPRWSAATWRFVLITAVVLFFVEVPGRRTGPANYQHGWPMAYLVQDFDPRHYVAWMPYSTAVLGLDAIWRDGTVPFELEQQLSPWSFAGNVRWWIVALDTVCGLLLLRLIGGSVDKVVRRRRTPPGRFFQFSLRTLLLVFSLAAICSAVVAGLHRQYLAEQAVLDLATGQGGIAAPTLVELVWAPPRWMPEWLLKPALSRWCARVNSLSLPTGSRQLLPSISALQHLQTLDCTIASADDAKCIHDLPELRELSISAEAVDKGIVIEPLFPLPNLRRLSTNNSVSLAPAALAGLSELKSLEYLDISAADGGTLDLRKQNGLRTLNLNRSRIRLFNDFTLVRFGDHPQLVTVDLSDARLEAASVEALGRLSCLQTLNVSGSPVDAPLILDGLPALTSVDIYDCWISSLALCNLPALDKLLLNRNHTISSLRLEHLPRLQQVDHSIYGPRYEVSLVDLPALDSFAVERSSDLFGPPPVLWLRRADGLPKLTRLALQQVRFHPETPRNIGRIKSLRVLDLTNSWFEDADAEQLASLVNLEHCNLLGTNITAAGLQKLAKLRRLEELLPDVPEADEVDREAEAAAAAARHGDAFAFWDNWRNSDCINNRCMPLFAGLQNVAALNLWNAHVTDVGLASLAGLGQTRVLNLSATRITDAGLKHLRGLTSLEVLGLADTAISGSGLRHLEALRNLHALDLAETEITDDALQNLKFTPNLEVLRLAGSSISEDGFVYLAALHKLRWLDLSTTAIMDTELAKLQRVSALDTLVLRNCPVHGSGFTELRSLPALQAIDLRSDEIDHEGFVALAALPHLHRLDLLGMSLERDDWASLAKAPELREISIAVGKPFTNEELAAIRSLPQLKKLNIAFVRLLTAQVSDSNPDRAAILTALRTSLAGVQVIQLTEDDFVANTFWSRAFDRPAGGRLSITLSDGSSIAPAMPSSAADSY